MQDFFQFFSLRIFLVFFLLFVCNPVQEEEESISNKSNYFPTSSTFFRPSLSHQRVINLHNAVLMALGGDIKVLESEIISVSSPHSLCQQQPFSSATLCDEVLIVAWIFTSPEKVS